MRPATAERLDNPVLLFNLRPVKIVRYVLYSISYICLLIDATLCFLLCYVRDLDIVVNLLLVRNEVVISDNI